MQQLSSAGLWAFFVLGADCLQFHSYYGDRMVLQRGGSNSSGSKIWGYGALGILHFCLFVVEVLASQTPQPAPNKTH